MNESEKFQIDRSPLPYWVNRPHGDAADSNGYLNLPGHDNGDAIMRPVPQRPADDGR